MKSVKLLIAALCAVTVSGFAFAGEEGDASKSVITTDAEKMEFKRLDANEDGAISTEEAEQGGVKEFAKADKNSDGKLTLDEYVAIARNEVSSL